jgi:hypothetical protein
MDAFNDGYTRGGIARFDYQPGTQAYNDAVRGGWACQKRQQEEAEQAQVAAKAFQDTSRSDSRGTGSADGSAGLTLLCLLLGAAKLFAVWMADWQRLGQPFRWVAGFYYYLVYLPLSSFSIVWNWGTGLVPNKDPLLQFIGGVVPCFFYGLFGLMLLTACYTVIAQKRLRWLLWLTVLGPGMFAAAWYLAKAARWLS